jgi:uncharacterized protein
MLKAVIVGLAVALLLWWVFGRAARGAKPPSAKSPGESNAETMVECAHCGLHLPRGDALAARGLHYCSVAHRDAPPDA